jgi:hypothetical protein
MHPGGPTAQVLRVAGGSPQDDTIGCPQDSAPYRTKAHFRATALPLKTTPPPSAGDGEGAGGAGEARSYLVRTTVTRRSDGELPLELNSISASPVAAARMKSPVPGRSVKLRSAADERLRTRSG